MTAYATADQLYAQPGVTVPLDTAITDLLLEAASQAIDGHCNRAQDGFKADVAATQRLYNGSGEAYLFIDEAVEITVVEWKFSLGDPTWTSVSLSDVVGFQGSPDSPNFNRFPYRALMLVGERVDQIFPTGLDGPVGWFWHTNRDRTSSVPNVRVTGRWGYADVIPSPVVQATIVQAARWLKRGQSFWADTASSGDFGSLQFRQSLDPDVKAMLDLARLVRPTYA